MLTLLKLKDMKPHTIIDAGIIDDNAEGINMAGTDGLLRWVAKRGEYHDWAIYIHSATYDGTWILNYGDKVCDENNIKRLVKCDEETFGMYRF